MTQRKGFFARVADLWKGFWGTQLSDAEARNAELVYHTAIQQRAHQQDKLKDAVGRMVYLRNRIEADLARSREDLSLVDQALLRAAGDDDDGRALQLIRKKRQLQTEIERLQSEHERLSAQADSAKQGLVEIARAVKRLKEEREEMLARKQHAIARMQVATAIEASTGNFAAADQALENVREAIVRLEHQADLDPDLGTDDHVDVSLTSLRRESEDRADHEALETLKLRLGKKLLPESETRRTIWDSVESLDGRRVEAAS